MSWLRGAATRWRSMFIGKRERSMAAADTLHMVHLGYGNTMCCHIAPLLIALMSTVILRWFLREFFSPGYCKFGKAKFPQLPMMPVIGFSGGSGRPILVDLKEVTLLLWWEANGVSVGVPDDKMETYSTNNYGKTLTCSHKSQLCPHMMQLTTPWIPWCNFFIIKTWKNFWAN